jgi:hypothetical protein
LPLAISILNKKISNFYLGYLNQPWFGPAGSENACVFRMPKQRVATKLKVFFCFQNKGPFNT